MDGYDSQELRTPDFNNLPKRTYFNVSLSALAANKLYLVYIADARGRYPPNVEPPLKDHLIQDRNTNRTSALRDPDFRQLHTA